MSTLKVDNLSSVDGNSTVLTGGNYRPGEIIEVISGTCDGRTVTGISGSYTLENVTAELNFSTTPVDVTGGTIVYTPPTGTNTVIYNFQYTDTRDSDTYSLWHISMFMDSDGSGTGFTEVTASRKSHYISYQAGHSTFQYVIQCNASTEDISKGQLTSWTTARTLKMQVREYNDTVNSAMHTLEYWAGTNNFQISPPQLTITAIA